MGDSQIQTRNRSRSKTPFLRSACDNEACAHAGEEGHHHHQERKKTPLKKAPNVETIVEETVVRSSTPTSNNNKITKASAKTSDYSSEDPSPDNSTEEKSSRSSAISSTSASTTTRVTSSTVVTKVQKSSTRSANVASTINSSRSLRKEALVNSIASPINLKEISQNEINATFEKSSIQTSTPIPNESGPKVTFKANRNGTSNGNGSNIAYDEYKEAGEYWKKYPKTDYVYSKLSPHRRELAPGIIAMPNMSRSSLEHHDQRINYMIERDPAQEDFIRRRYQAAQYSSQTQRYARDQLAYDSQDEVDSVQLQDYNNRYRYSEYHSETWIRRIVSTVVTTFYSFISLIVGDASEADLYRTKIQEEKGFFGRCASYISSGILSIFRKIYMGICSILYFDTLLLRSSNAKNASKKRFLLLLLILLPLLLLGGLYYYLNPTEPFPPVSFSQLNFTLPDLQFTEFVNSEKYDEIKASAFEKIDDLKIWTDDYFSYLKTVSQNLVADTANVLRENYNALR